MDTFTIGELAKRTGVGIETIRYYERCGLMPEPPRSPAGYRQYTQADVQRIEFIMRAKELGFSLKEIAELLNLRADTSTTCADIRRGARLKIADIEKRIRNLERMREALVRLVASCRGRDAEKEKSRDIQRKLSIVY